MQNEQDDVGVEDFIRSIKRAKLHCSQPNILLDFIIAQKIKGLAEKTIRFIPIDSYDDLFIFNALRQSLKQTGSTLALKSKLESCKQGITETVRNFSLRFRQITNKLNYSIQKQHNSPLKRRIRSKIEETEKVNRYLLNLRKEIELQIRLVSQRV